MVKYKGLLISLNKINDQNYSLELIKNKTCYEFNGQKESILNDFNAFNGLENDLKSELMEFILYLFKSM